MFFTITPVHQDRSMCGDCGCEGDIVRCSTEQNRVRKSGRITVVEAVAGEKTRFYPKTGILMLSKKFSSDGFHNASFKKWDFWSSIFFPDQIFVRRLESLQRNVKEIDDVLKDINWLSSYEYRDSEMFGSDRNNSWTESSEIIEKK